MNPPGLRPRSAEQFAGVYAFANRIVLVTYALAPGGRLVQGSVCFTVKVPATVDVLGYGVLQALESFLPAYPLPDDPAARRRTQLKAMGVRSERELQRSALFCSFHRAAGSIVFQPTHNGGHQGEGKGFRAVAVAAFAVPDTLGTAEVGAALCQALDLCTTVFD